MYCAACGAEISNGAKFCPKCGAAVKNQSYSAQAESTINPIRIRSGWSVARDFVSSKISGTEVKTVTISLKDMIDLLTEHFIKVAVTSRQRNRLHRALRGSLLGHYRHMHSADGKYYLFVRASIVPGLILFQGRLRNYMHIQEEGSGTVYQYEAVNWLEFRRAVNTAFNAN